MCVYMYARVCVLPTHLRVPLRQVLPHHELHPVKQRRRQPRPPAYLTQRLRLPLLLPVLLLLRVQVPCSSSSSTSLP